MSGRPPFQYSGQDPVSRRLTELVQRTESVFESALHLQRAPAKLLGPVANAQLLADQEIGGFHKALTDAAWQGRAKGKVCKAGCAYCCKRAPEATSAEALAAVNFAVQTLGEQRLNALKERASRYVAETASLRPDRIVESRVPCPFLEIDQCSVYVARPLSCRGLSSTDAAVCDRISRLEAPAEARPSLPDQLRIASAIRMGLRLGLLFESLDSSMLDLGYAAHIALNEPSVAEELLEGKDPFLDARLPYGLEPFDPADMSLWAPSFRSVRELTPPTGELPISVGTAIRRHTDLALETGDFNYLFQDVEHSAVAFAIAHMDVPRLYSSQAQILESREKFVAALRHFEAAGYDPSEAFDALSIHQTMNLTSQGMDDLEIMMEHGRIMVDAITSKCLPDLTEPIAKRPLGGKLKVGYISANLNRSNGGKWALGWLKNHCQEIETYCFFLGRRPDGATQKFRRAADHFFWLTRTAPEGARFIKSLNLDVLIFTDIGLNSLNTEYSALRMAPVQCTAWGHPDTSGLPTIDYYLSSELMEPEKSQDQYSEKLVKLPRSGLCYTRPESEPFSKTRADFGLEEGRPFLFMAQSLTKLLPQHDYLYAEMCERAKAPLVLLEGAARGDRIITERRLNQAGVPTHWLPFQSHQDFMSLMRLADVSLDPPLWSGGNSTFQALSLGIPVVTLPGPFMRSRHSYALLKIANVSGLIAKDESDYVDLASNFERQQEAMKDHDSSALFDDVEVVDSLDEFLLSVGAD